ncbi:putative pIN domain protein [Burkholderia multivorans]|nr:putative pIN domain protein [Burkholderia multivorans]
MGGGGRTSTVDNSGRIDRASREHAVRQCRIHLGIAIKYRKGNLPVHPRDARSAFRLAGFAELPISGDHIEGVAAPPDFPDHADPFDRVMVAQALHEGMPLVSADPELWRYHATLVLRA